SRNLVGEERCARYRADFGANAFTSGFIQHVGCVRLGRGVGPDRIRLRGQDPGLLGVDSAHHFFVIRRYFYWRMDVLQTDEYDSRAELALTSRLLNALGQGPHRILPSM